VAEREHHWSIRILVDSEHKEEALEVGFTSTTQSRILPKVYFVLCAPSLLVSVLILNNQRWSRLEAEWNYRETSRGKKKHHRVSIALSQSLVLANFDPEMLNYIKIIHFTGHAKPWKTSGGKYWQWLVVVLI